MLLVALLLCTLPCRGDGVAAAGTPSDRGEYHGEGRDTGGAIRLLRAGELRQEQRGAEEVMILTGDVKLIQDSLTIWCDFAQHRRRLGELLLRGNVIMVDPGRRLKADRVTYYEKERRSVASGNVQVLRDSVLLRSRTGRYDEQSEEAVFTGDMSATDLGRDIRVTGGRGRYNARHEVAEAQVNPVLVQFDSTGGETARIVAEYMRYNAAEGIAEARDSVRIDWEEVRGQGERLFYHPDDGMALLVGRPVIRRGRDEAVGDSIWLFVTDGKLDSVVVRGAAVAYTASDSTRDAPRSELRGKQIVMDFEEGVVARMQSDGQAMGLYHLFEKGEDKGSNRVSGDRVTLLMNEGSLEDVIVVGGTEGTYYPPRLAKKVRRDE